MVVDETIMLACMLFYNHMSKEHMCCIISRTNGMFLFCCLVCGVLAPGKLLPSPKEIVANFLLSISILAGVFLLCVFPQVPDGSGF